MYQDSYPYGYHHHNMYDFRDLFFSNRIGSFYTILNDLPVGGGFLPSGTRIFIHSVRLDAGGYELVTIVFAQNNIVRKTEVFGTDITKPAPTQQYPYAAPPRPPR
ncbi:hypothetical protein [Priestia megaterium]|uniref:hypothetical protein n=1 Tax=Priestia megaterium TaxID=1404 RepID=UPI002E1E7ABE|nr:hypothetical protein [Priestia megaterium]